MIRFYVFFIACFAAFSCEQHESKVSPKQVADFKFEVDDKVVTLHNVSFADGKLISNELQLVKAIHAETGKEITVFTLSQATNSNARVELHMLRKTTGYEFTGTCWVYGTTVEDNGVTIFFPASTTTRQFFPDICPPPGGAYAYLSKMKLNENC